MQFKLSDFIALLVCPIIISLALILPLILPGISFYTYSTDCSGKSVDDCLNLCECKWCDISDIAQGYCVNTDHKCIANSTSPYDNCTDNEAKAKHTGFALLMASSGIVGFATILGIVISCVYILIILSHHKVEIVGVPEEL